MPYKADTAIASLLKRNRERAIPVVSLDPSIPKGLSDIVSKCLERELPQRYQNVQELLTDLDAWQGKRRVAASSSQVAWLTWISNLSKKWVVVAAGAVIVTAGGLMLRGNFSSGSEIRKPTGVR